MNFGKRVAIREPGPSRVVQETCIRCFGTGWVRERGSRLTCKVCKGTGRVEAKAARAS